MTNGFKPFDWAKLLAKTFWGFFWPAVALAAATVLDSSLESLQGALTSFTPFWLVPLATAAIAALQNFFKNAFRF